MRVIGITHRIKQTKDRQARPTMVAILDNSIVVIHELKTETDELDFLSGSFPVKHRALGETEVIPEWFSEKTPRGLKPHHCKWRKLKDGELREDFPENRVQPWFDSKGNLAPQLCTHVPVAFDGLKIGDNVAMMLGGSGDRFAAALSRQGDGIGANVYRIPPNILKQLSEGEEESDVTHLLLARLLYEKLSKGARHDMRPFYVVRPRDRNLIRVKEYIQLRQDAMKARIACGQRIRQSAIGRVFLSEEGRWPEGVVEQIVREELASDAIYQQLEKEEERRHQQLKKAVCETTVWERIFEPIEGCGERIAADIIAAVGDIRRFLVEPNAEEMERLYVESTRLEAEGNFLEDADKIVLPEDTPYYRRLQHVRSWKRAHGKEEEAALLDKAIACHQARAKLRRKAYRAGEAKLAHFLGVFAKSGGKYADVPADKQFPRRRHGETSNWHPGARQALYLLADQFNRRSNSVWGKVRLQAKLALRDRHPTEVKVVVGAKGAEKRRYTDGHIHNMSAWVALRKFIRFLFREWTRLEREQLAKDRENIGKSDADQAVA